MIILDINNDGSEMVMLAVDAQLFRSITITVYVPATNPVMLAVVAELLQAKMYGAVPPAPLAVADPLLPPLQLTFVFATVDATNAVGSVIVVLDVVVQLFASVTVTVYVPATRPLAVADVAELLHAKVYGDVPPDPFAVAAPLLPPLQLTGVFEALAANSTGSVMVTLDVLVQELASDTVTV